MNLFDPSFLIAATAALVAMGGGGKWLLMRTDEKNRIAAAEQTELRAKFSERLQDEIKILRMDIALLKTKESLYLKRIYQLENYIHKLPDVDVPSLDGWPPT